MGSRWLLLFPGGLWMLTVISWLVGFGCLLLFPGGLWMVTVISWWALAKKAKLKKLQATGFEPRTIGIRSQYNYQLSYIRICKNLNIRECMA